MGILGRVKYRRIGSISFIPSMFLRENHDEAESIVSFPHQIKDADLTAV